VLAFFSCLAGLLLRDPVIVPSHQSSWPVFGRVLSHLDTQYAPQYARARGAHETISRSVDRVVLRSAKVLTLADRDRAFVLLTCSPDPAPRAGTTWFKRRRFLRQTTKLRKILWARCLRKVVNQSVEWLLRHWFTTGVDHELDVCCRCWTAEQASNGVSIEIQRRAVERIAESNGWDLTWLAGDGVSGAVSPESRKWFKAALAVLETGESEALIFTKVDSASRRIITELLEGS
jgi:Resolvase, N terminal domain